MLLLLACADAPSDKDTGGVTAAPCPDDPHAVPTTQGCVIGVANTVGDAFLGIPFAEPPVGDLRFAPPVPRAAWSEPFEASEYGNVCPQAEGSSDSMKDAVRDEDCLNLNVWRPDGAADLPVIVHVHGGGHLTGSGRLEYDDHPSLSESAVLVTVNYRLGPLGLLTHAGLTAETGSSGNQLLRDNLLALQWVADNITNFGGDPDNVTLWGFSAGATSTCALLAAPDAAPLVDRAFVQSGTCGLREPEREGGERNGATYAAALGCTGSEAEQVACLRGLDTDTLRTDVGVTFGILNDGDVLVGNSLPRFETGDYNTVPIYMGHVAEERAPDAIAAALGDADTLAATLRAEGADNGITDLDGLAARYTVEAYGSVDAAYGAWLTDLQYVCPTRLTLQAMQPWVDTHAWWFTHLPEEWAPGVVSHGADATWWTGDGRYANADEAALATTMRDALLHVADGTSTVTGLGDWPLNGGMDPDTWVQLDVPVAATTGVRADDCTWLLSHGLTL